MLIVSLNIVPGGQADKVYTIGRIVIVNTGDIQPNTLEYKYEGRFEKFMEYTDSTVSYVLHCDEMFHYREDGALDLIRKFTNDFTAQIKQKGLPR